MKNFSSVLLLLLGTVLLYSCGSALNSTPVKTIKDQTAGLHKTIEETTAKKHLTEKYQSLSYGQMKVFKPEAFVRLDSVYTLKQNYLNNNDLRGLHQSGIEELIPAYRAEAQQELHKVQYEIEHIYQITTDDSIEIHNSFFLFDYKDSLILVSPFYNFKLAKAHQDFYYAFQFDYHFVTNRNLYLSESEREFIRFFKNRQVELIGTHELQPFMNHTMNVMEAARKATTVDFREVSKEIVLKYFKNLGIDLSIEKFGKLMALEKNENVIGYEFEVEWINETLGKQDKTTKFSFSPYLEIDAILTVDRSQE